MSLKEEISPEIIANMISMDSIKEYYILVEGEKDFTFYSKFLDEDLCSFEISQGKENIIAAIKILNSRKIESKYFAIVDKDYDDILEIQEVENILRTDAHSLETMCLCSDSFVNFSREYFDETKLKEKSFQNSYQLAAHILKLSKPLSHLRIISNIHNYNFQFKPNNRLNETKELDYTKFISKSTLEFLGLDNLLETIKRYRNQGLQITNTELKERLSALDLNQYDLYQISHGHDISKIIVIGLQKALGKNSSNKATTIEVERAMRLAYTKEDFHKTELKKKIEKINFNLISR
ncbi:Protein of unknown function [Salegentibacter holothuriorum]|uniref:DUF4435 domain-containing protein n=1 Tax=Salegentibacter holothuriorum TaxID=241145 RepID=A0A1T5DYG5_9FLAO|nr:DUF4435 domain-containing protein [Salegentibacter holothuriorum]SKB76902.1 Protein of unknown function [Salegentibacter holothuriorum]